MNVLVFEESADLEDLASYAARARRLDPDAAMRVVVSTGTTVPVAAILDRVARARPLPTSGPVSLGVPPVRVFAPWAGVSSPRSGWEPSATIPSAELVATAAAGIAEIAAAGTGLAAQVEALRARVWGQPLHESGAPAGLALAAYGLGF